MEIVLSFFFTGRKILNRRDKNQSTSLTLQEVTPAILPEISDFRISTQRADGLFL
jgi:hypothetical protein